MTPRKGRGRGRGRLGGPRKAINIAQAAETPTAELADAVVDLFIRRSDEEPRMKVGSATVFGSGGQLTFMNHGHDVRQCQNAEHDVCLVWKVTWEPGMETLPYPYSMPHNDEQPTPVILHDFISGFRYAWEVTMVSLKNQPRVSASVASNSAGVVSADASVMAVGSPPPAPVTKRPAGRVSPYPRRTARMTAAPSVEIEPVTTPVESIPQTLEEDSGVVPLTPKMANQTVTEVHGSDSEDSGAEEPNPVMESTLNDTVGFDIKSYHQVSVYVNVNDIEFLQHAVRDTEDSHIDDLEREFKEKGILTNAGTITVTIADPTIIADVEKHVNSQNRLTAPCVGVDGRHRTMAFKRLQRKQNSASLAEKYTWVMAELWLRKDNAPMSELEIISVGANLNETNSTVRPNSFIDNVHSAMSCVSLITEMTKVPLENVSRSVATKIMTKLQSLPGAPVGQYVKYTGIALAFVRNGIASSVLKQFPLVGLVHASNNTFLKLDRTGMLLGLECVSAYLQTPAPKHFKKGPFENAGHPFFDAMRLLYAQVRKAASEQVPPLQVEELLDSTLPVGPSTSVLCRHLVRNQMASFVKKADEKMRKSQDIRVRAIRKYLNNYFGVVVVQPGRTSRGTASTGTATASASASAGGPRRSTRRTAGQRTADAAPSEPPAKRRKAARKKPITSQAASRSLVKLPIISKKAEVVESSSDYASSDSLAEDDESKALGVVDDPFDEDNPALLPTGYNDRPVWKGPPRPTWIGFMNAKPSSWPESNPIQHVSPWLSALSIPLKHRSHIMCTTGELRAIHAGIFRRAAYLEHKRLGSTTTSAFGKKLPVAKKSPNSALQFSAEEALWKAADEMGETAYLYLSRQSTLLNQQGFCVLEGFASDERLPEGVEGSHPDGDVIKKLESFFLGTFPENVEKEVPVDRMEWNAICNAGERDKADQKKGVGRYITTVEGICSSLEQNVNKVWVAKARALLDVRVAQLLASVRLGSDQGVDKMKTPMNGGRFLYTTDGCPRQALHTDFEVNKRKNPDRIPGYFAIVTGSQAAPLWVVPQSHFVLRRSSKSIKMIAKAVEAEKLVVPPYSVFFGRGDLSHAGPGSEDYDTRDFQGCLRYHLYFVPHDSKLVDGVHFVHEFHPKFQTETATYDSSHCSESSEEGPRSPGSDKDDDSDFSD